jgi:Uma2 family endonuclease
MDAMRATTPPQRMTVEEFLALPETEDASRWELVEGEVVVSEPTWEHQNAVKKLLLALELWRVAAPRRGKLSLNVDTAVGPQSMLSPDLQWWAEGRELNDPRTRPQPLGDLVVEVRSPSTWAVDVGRKRAIYERERVQELWLVDPLSSTILVFARSAPDAPEFDVMRDLGPDGTLASPLLPEFALSVSAVFAAD